MILRSATEKRQAPARSHVKRQERNVPLVACQGGKKSEGKTHVESRSTGGACDPRETKRSRGFSDTRKKRKGRLPLGRWEAPQRRGKRSGIVLSGRERKRGERGLPGRWRGKRGHDVTRNQEGKRGAFLSSPRERKRGTTVQHTARDGKRKTG